MRTYLPQPINKPEPRFSQPILDLEAFLAIYARQSTKEQVINNREAYDQQTRGLLQQGCEFGWDASKIVVYIENKRADGKWVNASGRLRIDQRPGLQALTERIEKNEVKAVLVWAVDRLFRDEDMIQPAVFAKLCKEHHCLVITTDDVFDFNNPRRDDRKRFLEAAQEAADYVTKHVKGRMHPAREQLSLKGQADSRRIAIGYIVTDRRRYLADGSDNPDYKRFVIYEPHAKIIRYLFRRFRELGGNLRVLYREIDRWPFIFPFFEDPKHAKYVQLTKNDKGYKISRTGLASLLTNPVYIGWWYYKGQIVSKQNHEPIVSEDDFWYAFNRLSPRTIEGERNVRPTSQKTRYNHPGFVVPQALLQGIIQSEELPVYVLATTDPPAYAITDTDKKYGPRYKVSISVSELDRIFMKRLYDVLLDVKDLQAIRERLQEVRTLREQQLVSVDDQIEEVKRQIVRAKRDKRIAEEEDYEEGIREAFRELKSKKAILAELEQKKAQATIDEAELKESYSLLNKAYTRRNTLTFEQWQRFVRLITKSVTLTQVSPRFLKLEIVWTDWCERTDIGYLWRNFGNGGRYTDEENAIIRQLYPIADRVDILESMPNRSWSGILIQARHLGLSRHRSCGNSSKLHIDLSLQDSEILKLLGVQYNETWPDKQTWWLTSSRTIQKLHHDQVCSIAG